MVTVLGLNIAYLVGGTLVVEQVFALPGHRRADDQLDLPARLHRSSRRSTLVFAILVVLVNLLTDIVHSLLDPRVRFD